MRDVIFRGIGIKSREWVYGAYVPAMDEDDCDSIIDEQGEHHIVFSDTVGQYTGMKDKNGKKIFEGDIIHTKQYGKDEYGLNHCGYDIFSVRFINSSFRIESNNRWFYLTDGHHIEVIGNIHDHPDLLK